VATALAGNYPFWLRSTIDPSYSLTAANTASTRYGLGVAMAWWVVGITLVACYFTYLFHSMGGRSRPKLGRAISFYESRPRLSVVDRLLDPAAAQYHVFLVDRYHLPRRDCRLGFVEDHPSAVAGERGHGRGYGPMLGADLGQARDRSFRTIALPVEP